MAQFDRKAESAMIKRVAFLAVTLSIVAFLVILSRFFIIQVADYEFYRSQAMDNQTRDKTIYATRGTIYDTNMKPLAISAPTEMVTIEPIRIEDDAERELIVSFLSETLGVDYDTLMAKASKESAYEEVARGVESDVADVIRDFRSEHGLNSIFFWPDTTRYYPYGNFLSHVLGFVGTDIQGLYGLEIEYDEVLSGTPGRIVTATNRAGDEMPVEYETYYDAQDGHSLVLTIDEVLQHYLEKNLEVAYNDNKVNVGVTGIVMDVNTGGILAMASLPDFDPNEPFKILDAEVAQALDTMPLGDERTALRSDYLTELWRNKAISDTYYPGSTFKIITAAIALEESAAVLGDTYHCSGSTMVEGWRQPIRCWKTEGHGTQTFEQAIQNSCNPAFIEIGQSIGWDAFEKYYEAFGFKEQTDIDLPGEGSGLFFSSASPVNLAVMSFGQNFTITPLQLITSVSAVANGGMLVTPHLVQQIIDAEGNIIESHESNDVRQVISIDTAQTMNQLLEDVVTYGTGKNAYTVGYRVAGKTGTTEKIADQNETGETDLRISSFVAFAPANDPQIAVLILLDEPTVQPVTGGVTVAPVVRRFMEEALPYLNVEAVYTAEELEQRAITVPDIVGMTKAEAETALSAAGLSGVTDGAEDIITAQLPAAGAVVSSKASVIMYMGSQVPDKTIVVPDLTNDISFEKARTTLDNIGLYINVAGAIPDGTNVVVTKQYEEAGSEVPYGSVITVELTDLDQQAE